jgi:hypothetical protein
MDFFFQKAEFESYAIFAIDRVLHFCTYPFGSISISSQLYRPVNLACSNIVYVLIILIADELLIRILI